MRNTVYLRADGGPNIGWGHVNRLCALAAMLPETLELVAVSSETGAAVFRQNLPPGVDIKVLDANTCGRCSAEWKDVQAGQSILVLDGYHFDQTYQQEAKSLGFAVVIVDDFALGPFAADVIINHAPNSRQLYTQEGITYCCGLEYALLRPDFYQTPPAAAKRNGKVLITLGGADPQDLTLQLLEQLVPAHPELHWTVVCTDNFSEAHRSGLQRFSQQHPQVDLEYNLTQQQMHRLMLECSRALTAASTVVLEAWASGLYPAALCYTENQRILFDGICSEGIAFPLEWNRLSHGFERYLNQSATPQHRDSWNPPLAIRRTFLQLTSA
ncbi:MAG: UDP-2,4-diacetamido-2,4, 6-trideoxy-beta-L-altropyranose hydrolase [Bacteroidota bacterium]